MFIARINASRLQTMRSRLQILCPALPVVIVIAGVYSIALAEEKASAWELRSGWRVSQPTQEQASKRALCLAALVMRGEFEQMLQRHPKPVSKEPHTRLITSLNQWLINERLITFQSKEERRLFKKPAGTWSQQELINASWRIEALGVLAWALSIIDKLPEWDTQFDQASIIKAFGLMSPTTPFLRRVKLRPAQELVRMRGIAELWHWRCRTTQIIREGVQAPKGYTFDGIVQAAATRAHQNGDIPEPIANDFPALGKAFKNLNEEEYSLLTSISTERHFALNWLCGYSNDWDKTPTDT